MTPCGYQQITATTMDAGGVQLTIPATTQSASQKAQYVMLEAEGQAVRWRDDGTNPTASVGMLLPVNTPTIYNGSLTGIRFISAVAGSILNISYYY